MFGAAILCVVGRRDSGAPGVPAGSQTCRPRGAGSQPVGPNDGHFRKTGRDPRPQRPGARLQRRQRLRLRCPERDRRRRQSRVGAYAVHWLIAPPKSRTRLLAACGRKEPLSTCDAGSRRLQARRVAELNLEGVGFIKEDRRFYPKKKLASQLLGFVGVDNKGLAGIEAAYDAQISGAVGKLLYQTDARGRAFSRLERPPTAGATVELTIDEYLAARGRARAS